FGLVSHLVLWLPAGAPVALEDCDNLHNRRPCRAGLSRLPHDDQHWVGRPDCALAVRAEHGEGVVARLQVLHGPQLVGERSLWTATATDCGASPVYQFSVAPSAGAFRVVRDYSPSNTFAWTPMQEGSYDIKCTVEDGYQATETTSTVVSDTVASRVTGSAAV